MALYLHGIAQCMLHTSSHAEVSCSVQLVLDEDGEFHLRNTSQEFLRTKKRQPKQLKLVREPVSVSIIKYHIVYSTELRVEEEIELLCINIHCALRTYQVATALWQTPFATTSSYSSVIQSARLLV